MSCDGVNRPKAVCCKGCGISNVKLSDSGTVTRELVTQSAVVTTGMISRPYAVKRNEQKL